MVINMDINIEKLANQSKKINAYLATSDIPDFIKNKLITFLFDPNLKNDEFSTIWIDIKNDTSLPHSGKNHNDIRESKLADTVREITKEINEYTKSDHGSPVATFDILKYPLNSKIDEFFQSVLYWNNYFEDKQLYLFKSWKLFNFEYFVSILEMNNLCLWSFNTGYINFSDIHFSQKIRDLYIFWKTSNDRSFVKSNDFSKLFREYILYDNDINYWKNNVLQQNLSICSGNIKFIIENYFINLYILLYTNDILQKNQAINDMFVEFFDSVGILVKEPVVGEVFDSLTMVAQNSGNNFVKSIVSPAFFYESNKVYMKAKVLI
ncbi:MAG: hypothetical protein LBB39_02340 [Mycoplasmataceae bacterium]|nr:hypothetical protein [Mycoplasmataceae bacterium]